MERPPSKDAPGFCFNNLMDGMKTQLKGSKTSIIISACHWDFLQVSFHCGISNQRSTGSSYWTFVGVTHLNVMTVTRNILLHLTTVCL